MAATKQKKENLVFPAGGALTNEELAKVVKDAEKGPFYTTAEVKQALKKWSKKHSR